MCTHIAYWPFNNVRLCLFLKNPEWSKVYSGIIRSNSSPFHLCCDINEHNRPSQKYDNMMKYSPAIAWIISSFTSVERNKIQIRTYERPWLNKDPIISNITCVSAHRIHSHNIIFFVIFVHIVAGPPFVCVNVHVHGNEIRYTALCIRVCMCWMKMSCIEYKYTNTFNKRHEHFFLLFAFT